MAEGLTGNLSQLALPDLLRMLSAGRQSGRLDLADRGERGVLFLRDGTIVHAGFGPLSGERATRELLSWVGGAFRFEPRVASPDVTIDRPLEVLLLEAERLTAERDAIRRAIPSLDRVMRLATAAPPGPVTLSPLQWQAVTLVDGTRSVEQIVGALAADELESLQALGSLVTAGLLLLDQPIAAPAPRNVVSMEFFRQLRAAAAAAIGPLAPVIIEDEVAALGATFDTFPRERLSVLVERVAAEIQDDDRRMQFEQRLLQVMRQMAA